MFHKFRFSEALLKTWSSFLCAVKAPLPLQVEAQLTLQLLVDRLFKRLITITAAETDCKYKVQKAQDVHLTLREQNAIRYMAGYVAVKLKTKYKKTISKHAEVAKKRELFVKVLSGMEADQQVDGVDSIESYTRTWT